MKGDFSRWEFDDRANTAGVLHQQGRVLTDDDWNEQTRLADRWQLEAGRAAFGRRVAAVSVAEGESFLVTRASLSAGGEITLEVNAGQVWVDGLLAYLRESGPAVGAAEARPATYLVEPPDGPPRRPGTRDAVILELWREALHGFQVPHRLIEAALGGVDTTERIWHGLAFRLLRLAPGEGCEEILDRLEDDLSARGRLTVELEPTEIRNGDCPVVVGGGYTGFEHDLYRVEIAQVDSGVPMFKWSRFNGGLVGRGTFDADKKKLTIRANRQPILRSGLQSFYLEAYEPLPERPPQPAAPDRERTAELAEEWSLVYGGRAVLASDEEIDLTDDLFGVIPGPKERRFFFRLWDDVRSIGDFSGGAAVGLRDGIRLRFQSGGDFRSGDYWTFPVRAGDVGNEQTLIDDQPPEGVRRVRVPLAVLHWSGAAEITHDADEIEDCRKVFPPLTDLPPGCCVTIAPGTDLGRWVERLKRAGGGCLCLLPGEHRLRGPVDLRNAANITISGYGLATRLVAGEELGSAPVFDLTGATNIAFRSFAILQRGPAPVFSCAGTRTFALEGMLVAAPAFPASRPLIELRDTACSGWRLEDNTLLGAEGLTGLRLTRSRIAANRFAGIAGGLHLSDLLEVVLKDNRFLGVSTQTEAAVEALLGDDRAASAARRAEAAPTAEALVALFERLELAARQDPRSRYVALRASSLFDVEITGNLLVGRVGLLGEIVENCTVEGNRILTTMIGAGFGLVHGLRFAGNRVGEMRTRTGSLSPRIGLRILSDSVDCRILENHFLDVRDAIVFETDLTGEKDVLRAADVDFRAFSPDEVEDREILAAAKDEISAYRAETRFLASTYFRVGKCERTLIEGNVIRADGTGIEWSGTKEVRDFRVSRNAFAGCGNGGVLIEPDDRVHYLHLAEPVDTQVRLIEHNRFDILGVAVRSTLGAVRVEKNDIRVRPAPTTFLPPGTLVGLLTEEVFKLPAFAAAAAAKDIGNLRMGSKAASFAVEKNPEAINAKSFATKAGSRVLAGRTVDRGDSLTDSAFLLSKVALAEEKSLIAVGAASLLIPLLADLEGFVINLGGIQNEVVNNNLLSRNDGFHGGVVLQLPSGMIIGNEIQVGRLATMVTAKAGQGRQNLRIEGNRLKVTGPARGDGKRSAAYALAIPTLTPGNYAILDNSMEGSVMVGAEPFASSGLVKKDTLDFGNFIHVYHALAFDASSFFGAISKAAKPAKAASATAIDPKTLNAILGVLVRNRFDLDPHKDRAVIQFADNRVARGYVAIARSTAGALWTKADLEREARAAPIVQVTGNVFDYWARVVGRDVILVGNHSQTAILYRAGNRSEKVANMPEPAVF